MKQSLTLSILISFILLTTTLYAQDYVLTAKGDTLKGEVKMFVNGVEKRVQVTQENKKKTTLNILQVKSFVLKKELYRTVKFGDTYVFMKLLKEGYLSLYSFQLNGQLTYDGRYLLKLDGKGIEVPNLGFKKNMTRFLSECNNVTSQIESGTYGYSDLDTIIDLFNQCINSNTFAQTAATLNSKKTPTVNLDQWEALETKIQASSINEKNDALEMVKEIKNKLIKGEQIPKFLSEALKSA
ncbi:MAG: hypothetical protein EBU52_15640, partial [Cytophagia bacterium]|nr:hypothetical protein [Cytophagia bacterium]